jgi:molybdopterin-guanine dinucleotide biosynthesis protein A
MNGRPLLRYVVDRLATQASPLALNANGSPSRFAIFGLPVIPDATGDFAGPLAGILAGMRWAAQTAPGSPYIVTAACDTPFLPGDLAGRLLEAAASSANPAICLAASGGRTHPVCGLWPVALAADLTSALAAGAHKVLDWATAHPHRVVEFPFKEGNGRPLDPFFNTNTPGDLAEAEFMLNPARRP